MHVILADQELGQTIFRMINIRTKMIYIYSHEKGKTSTTSPLSLLSLLSLRLTITFIAIEIRVRTAGITKSITLKVVSSERTNARRPKNIYSSFQTWKPEGV